MPPRYAYWTIIAGRLPTAFRMTEREELLPTFRRIKQTHPDAEMKYFARGRLWSSPEEARAESARLRAEADARRARATSRGRAWRPGGDHRDPQQKFKDAKKVRNQDRRQERFDRQHKTGAPPSGGGAPARRTSQSARAPRTEWRDRPRNDQPPRDRARRDGARLDRPQQKDRGDQGFRGKPPAARDRPRPDRGPRTARPPISGDRPPRDRARQDGAPGDRPREDDRRDRPFRGKPAGTGDRRPASTRPAPRSGSKPDGSYGSPKGSWARKPESKSQTSGSRGRPPGNPGRDSNRRGPAKDRRR